MTHTKEQPKCMSSPLTRTALPSRLTVREITSQDTSFPGRRWNTPRKLSSGRKMPIGTPQSRPENLRVKVTTKGYGIETISEDTTK